MNGWIRYRAAYGSWHIVRNWTRVEGQAVTLCGRTASGATAAIFPNDEPSCESCARIALRNEATVS